MQKNTERVQYSMLNGENRSKTENYVFWGIFDNYEENNGWLSDSVFENVPSVYVVLLF